MSVSERYRDFVIEQLAEAGAVTSRRMFGGVGLYLDGLFFALIDDDTLYLKADDANRPAFVAAGSRAFCPYPDRPDRSMGYWSVPAEVLEDAEALAAWARESAAAALRSRAGRPRRRRVARAAGKRRRR